MAIVCFLQSGYEHVSSPLAPLEKLSPVDARTPCSLLSDGVWGRTGGWDRDGRRVECQGKLAAKFGIDILPYLKSRLLQSYHSR